MSLQKETVKEVPIEKLSVEQLNYVGQQIEKEIKNYSQYYSSLRAVNNKYLDNKEYIKQLKEYKDKEILVPMTSSLYIPGKCADVKKLTIEIGANFFVETTIEKAILLIKSLIFCFALLLSFSNFFKDFILFIFIFNKPKFINISD